MSDINQGNPLPSSPSTGKSKPDWLVQTTEAMLLAAGILLLLTTVIILAEMVARKFFGTTIQGVDEIAGYGMAISFSLAMANSIFRHTHVSVDVLYQVFPSRLKLILGVLSVGTFSFYMAVLVYHCIILTLSSYTDTVRGTGLLGTPLYIPQMLWTAGLFITFLILIATLLRILFGLFSGDRQKVWELLGQGGVDAAVAAENIDDVLEEARGTER